MDLEHHYHTLWKKSLQQFKNGSFEYDSMIDADHDPRYGITLIARPSKAVSQAIIDTLDQLAMVAPRQYIYPPTDLHLTILSIISCYPGFRQDDIQPERYSKMIKSAVQNMDSFRIHFRGFTASPSSVLVRGFPEDNQLTQLRDTLREKFKSSSLQHSIDKRYRLETAHMTVLRFKQPLQQEQPFIDRLIDLKDTDFGSCTVNKLDLVTNDWYQRQKKVQLIERVEL